MSTEFFDWAFYKLVYNTNNTNLYNYETCFEHFLFNKNINNIFLNKNLDKINDLLYFNFEDYNNRYKLYDNLTNENKLNIFKHWNTIGIFNGNYFNKNSNKDNNIFCLLNNNRKTAIIYVYYNRKNEYFNETNLSFFIRQTILKEDEEHSNKHYLFYINNKICEINFPIRKNVEVIYNNNCFDFDAYGQGINYLKQKFINFYTEFSHILLMNCSVTGPFLNDNSSDWLEKFNNQLNTTNSTVCSNVLSRLNPGNKVKLPGYLLYFKNSEYLLNELKDVLFRKKQNKYDCILNGELAVTDVLIKNNIKFTSLSKYNSTFRYDRNTKDNIYDISFIKINWRSTISPNRDSLPVRSKEIFNLINKCSNFMSNDYLINYNYLSCANSGKNDYDNKFNWNSKERFYNLYGYSEEFITFPIIQTKINGIALYCHYSNKKILNNYCIESIKTLMQLNYDIILLTNCYTFDNISNLPFKIITIKDSTNDYFMIKNYLSQEINIQNIINNYEYLLFINDSIAFPIRKLDDVKKTFEYQRSKSNFWGLWTSPEHKKHIISSFIEFKIKDNKKLFQDFIQYINLFDLSTKENAIKLEINLLEHFQNLGYKYSVVVEHSTLNNLNGKICPIFHPEIFPQWISRQEVFAFKIKYMGNYINKIKLDNPYLNYLLRYWHFDHTGPKGEPEKQNVYKCPTIYLK